MRKLKYSFSRQALNQIIWDGCTEQDKTALERLQNEAARIVTGITRSTSIVNLYKECGWDSLANRRHFQKRCFMYKCSNNLVPDYISEIIPPRVAEVSNYPLRNRCNISNVNNRTETARRSFIPSSVTHWNSLRTLMLEKQTLIYLFVEYLKTKSDAMRMSLHTFWKIKESCQRCTQESATVVVT